MNTLEALLNKFGFKQEFICLWGHEEYMTTLDTNSDIAVLRDESYRVIARLDADRASPFEMMNFMELAMAQKYREDCPF
jgi:hypothetical protein